MRYTQWPANPAACVLSNKARQERCWPWRRRPPGRVDVERRYAWHHQLDIVGVYPAPIAQAGSFTGTVRCAARRRPWLAGPFSLLYGAVWTARKMSNGRIGLHEGHPLELREFDAQILWSATSLGDYRPKRN